MENSEDVLYFDELVEPFYIELKEGLDNLRNGQLCLAPVPRLETELRVWRPVFNDEIPYEFATADHFRIHDGDVLYGHKKPLKQPIECRTDEELWCCRVRQRVVIILANTRLTKAYQDTRHGEQIHCDSFLVVPTYEIVDSLTGKVVFHPETVECVRRMETPNFFFVPEYPILKFADSLGRVDRVFSICRTLLKPLPAALTDETFSALKELMGAFLFREIQGETIKAYLGCVGKE
ncbi:MAG: hypothetical protein JXI43_10680 [Tissierellales bacterium]|nr:hypothetical protein [Tissierellales bacterium]